MNIDNSFRYISNNSSCVSNESEHTKKIGAWMYSSTAQTAMSGSSYGFGFDDENLNEDSLCTNNYPSMNNVKSNSCTQGKFQSSFEINNKKSRNQKLVSPENRRILQVSNSTQKAAVSRPFPIPVYPNDKSSSKIINSQMSRTYHIPVSSDQSSSRAISLPATHIPRTQSEQQLRDDTAAAEWRDLCMFHRLVGGIRERQVDRWRRRQTYISSPSGAECDKMIEQSIASIVRHHREDLQTDIEDDYFIEDKNTSLFEYNNQMSSVCNIPFYDDDEPLETSDNDDDDVFTMDL